MVTYDQNIMSSSHQFSCEHDGVCCKNVVSSAVCQTMDEMEFERGIWSAAMNGDVAAVEKHLQRGTAPNIRDNFGYTALHYASRHGQTKVCELLLRKGACTNCQTSSGGVTPLHRAAYKGALHIVELLLQNGANPGLCDQDGQNALHKAAEGGSEEVIRLLVKRHRDLASVPDKRERKPVDCVKNKSLIPVFDNT